MRGTASADSGASGPSALTVTEAARPDRLPADAQALLAPPCPPAGGPSSGVLFSSRMWWDLVLDHAMPPDDRAAFVSVRSGDRVLLLVPMLRRTAMPRLCSLTTPYTCLYAPLFAAGLDAPARLAAWRAFARFCRPAGVIRLDAMAACWPELPALEQAAAQVRLRPLRFDHFGNWHEDVAGLGWAGYLARRPGALRETIRRRLRKAEAVPDAAFELLSSPEEMPRATDAFEAVYAKSWKNPEPFPRFNTALMRAAAARGILRFGLWRIGEQPVAVQIWVVTQGQATVLKLAHDEAFKPYSPGTVLTALMLRHLLDREQVVEIDFGRGDDDYKRNWAASRRQRIGLLLVDPLHPAGLMAYARHAAGQFRARLRR
jgi:CelD/BcsL family acetyltransferase involved in cellulose biosynthesis